MIVAHVGVEDHFDFFLIEKRIEHLPHTARFVLQHLPKAQREPYVVMPAHGHQTDKVVMDRFDQGKIGFDLFSGVRKALGQCSPGVGRVIGHHEIKRLRFDAKKLVGLDKRDMLIHTEPFEHFMFRRIRIEAVHLVQAHFADKAAFAFERRGAAADNRMLLEHGHVIAVLRQQRTRAQPAQTRAHNHDTFHLSTPSRS